LALVLTLGLGLSLAGAGSSPRPTSQISWIPRGAYSGIEFTSIVSPAGFPCVIAFTALQNGGLRVSTDCAVAFADLLFANAHAVTAETENIGYVAAGSAGMIKTVDQGISWFPINDGLPMGADARDVAIHFASPETVYCGLQNGGVYRGEPRPDSLIHWVPMNDGLGDLAVRTLVRVRGGTFFLAGTDGGIWRYESGSWSPVAPGVVANRLVIDAADSSRVYAATETGVYKSRNAGLSFAPSSTGLPPGVAVNDIARMTDVPRYLYVGLRGQGVYESDDFGESWHAFGPALPGENDVRAILATFEPDTAHVFAGTRVDGLFEAQIDATTQTEATTWGRLKNRYR
jgi:photosystem II stability/assembly factor-like uncharacterized protein